MLMSRMRRWNVILVLVASIAIATQPITHNHSLIPDGVDDGRGAITTSSLQCAFCATQNARTTVVVAQFATPLPSATDYSEPVAPVVARELSGKISSRAPPAAV